MRHGDPPIQGPSCLKMYQIPYQAHSKRYFTEVVDALRRFEVLLPNNVHPK